MGKLKSLLICAAALCCPVFICTGSAAGKALRSSAYFAAGALPGGDAGNPGETDGSSDEHSDVSGPQIPLDSDPLSNPDSDINANMPVHNVQLIDKNRSDYVDNTDYSKYTKRNGRIYRYAYSKSVATNFVDLASGAQVRNMTNEDNSIIEEVMDQLPDMHIYDPASPTVLIYHSHTSESFMPEGNTYDKSYPDRSQDDSRNMTAVGDALCEALVEHGVSVVHDCTVHDYPQYIGSYSRSAETILKNLDEFPSLKIIIDIHRDGIVNSDGSLVAPVVEINGRSAAQFMIVSGYTCEGEFEIPHYAENLKLACLLQNISEQRYPNLARSVLFDYREYNQSMRPGILLIEVGSHGNSLDEAVYTGELLGEIIAEAVMILNN